MHIHDYFISRLRKKVVGKDHQVNKFINGDQANIRAVLQWPAQSLAIWFMEFFLLGKLPSLKRPHSIPKHLLLYNKSLKEAIADPIETVNSSKQGMARGDV